MDATTTTPPVAWLPLAVGVSPASLIASGPHASTPLLSPTLHAPPGELSTRKSTASGGPPGMNAGTEALSVTLAVSPSIRARLVGGLANSGAGPLAAADAASSSRTSRSVAAPTSATPVTLPSR